VVVAKGLHCLACGRSPFVIRARIALNLKGLTYSCRRHQDAAAGGVGGAFLRAGCCQGADPGRGEACGV
jgi:hypothetical protein